MTPEERFTRIENFLSTVAEHQAHHEEDIRELREMHKGMTLAITKVAEAQRSTADAHRLTEEAHRLTEEAQQVTEKKLNALIDTVDRIIGKPGGQPLR